MLIPEIVYDAIAPLAMVFVMLFVLLYFGWGLSDDKYTIPKPMFTAIGICAVLFAFGYYTEHHDKAIEGINDGYTDHNLTKYHEYTAYIETTENMDTIVIDYKCLRYCEGYVEGYDKWYYDNVTMAAFVEYQNSVCVGC